MLSLLRLTSIPVVLLLGAACSDVLGGKADEGKLGAQEFEGDNVGECSDGADNDRDGYFDCDDNGCWGSPDCAPNGNGSGDADTDVDADADGDVDTDDGTVTSCNDDLCDLTEVDISYVANFDMWFDDGYGTAFGNHDCTLTLEGSGTFVHANPGEDRVTFYGTWRRDDTQSDCEFGLEDTVWFDHTTEEAWHTFFFNSSMDQLNDWFAHQNESGFTVDSSNTWYVTEIYEPYDHSQENPAVFWELIEPVPAAFLDLHHELEITFTK